MVAYLAAFFVIENVLVYPFLAVRGVVLMGNTWHIVGRLPLDLLLGSFLFEKALSAQEGIARLCGIRIFRPSL